MTIERIHHFDPSIYFSVTNQYFHITIQIIFEFQMCLTTGE